MFQDDHLLGHARFKCLNQGDGNAENELQRLKLDIVRQRPEKCQKWGSSESKSEPGIEKTWKWSFQINKFQYQYIRSRAGEITKNELQESQNMFGSSRGPRQAKNKHWEFQNQHFSRLRKCQKWASGSAIRNVQVSFGSIETNTFEPCMAREKVKNDFADVPRWPSLGHARFKCLN